MGVTRFFRWSCDACGATEEREDYGLPQGWIYVKALKITHRCPACQEDIPPAKRGTPKVVAER